MTNALSVFIIAILFTAAHGGSQMIAEADLVATGYEYGPAAQIKIGDHFTVGSFILGFMMSSRNEPRFNQGMLPNHNWRGFGFLRYPIELQRLSALGMHVTAGIEHESAHPTMGIEEKITSYHEQIYDGEFRRYLLNSVSLACDQRLLRDEHHSIDAKLEYRWYFMSKNTPELLTMRSAFSNGLSGGLEGRIAVKGPFSIAASVYHRFIMRSAATDYGELALSRPAPVFIQETNYPVVNTVYTTTAKAALEFSIARQARTVRIYASTTLGTVHGFVDSREKRKIIAGGLELSH